MFKNTCVVNCPDRFFIRDKKCLQCHSKCYNCDGESQNNCISCYESESLFDFSCVEKCPESTYNFDLNRVCKKCTDACFVCDEEEKNDDCVGCLDAEIIENNVCK